MAISFCEVALSENGNMIVSLNEKILVLDLTLSFATQCSPLAQPLTLYSSKRGFVFVTVFEHRTFISPTEAFHQFD
jgi:hypothetical protein